MQIISITIPIPAGLIQLPAGDYGVPQGQPQGNHGQSQDQGPGDGGNNNAHMRHWGDIEILFLSVAAAVWTR